MKDEQTRSPGRSGESASREGGRTPGKSEDSASRTGVPPAHGKRDANEQGAPAAGGSPNRTFGSGGTSEGGNAGAASGSASGSGSAAGSAGSMTK
jgi:hypothetical protein